MGLLVIAVLLLVCFGQLTGFYLFTTSQFSLAVAFVLDIAFPLAFVRPVALFIVSSVQRTLLLFRSGGAFERIGSHKPFAAFFAPPRIGTGEGLKSLVSIQPFNRREILVFAD